MCSGSLINLYNINICCVFQTGCDYNDEHYDEGKVLTLWSVCFNYLDEILSHYVKYVLQLKKNNFETMYIMETMLSD